MDNQLFVHLSYNDASHTKEQIEADRRLFDDICVAKAQAFRRTFAGSGCEFDIVVELLMAVAGSIAYDALKILAAKLLAVFDNHNKGSRPPHLESIVFNFQDRSIIFGYGDHGEGRLYSPDEFALHRTVLENIESILRLAQDHITTTPLAEQDFQYLRVPVRCAYDEDSAPLARPVWKLSDAMFTRFGYGTYYRMGSRTIFHISEKP